MAFIRANQGSSGGTLTETVLWTNSSPTSAFASQLVTLSDAMSNYKYIKIYDYFATSDTTESNIIFSTDELVIGTTRFMLYGTVPGYNASRLVMFSADTSVTFGAGIYMNTSTTDNSTCIPVKICGLN